ncbi:MAG: VCBS repeat-containing protein, partial [Akkermansiaceae bacterium]
MKRHFLFYVGLPGVLFLSSCRDEQPESKKEGPPPKKLTPVEGSLTARPLPQREEETGPLFELMDPAHTGVNFGLRWDDPSKVIKEFLFLNPSGGICVGDIDGDDLPDIYVTSPSGGNRLYRNLGSFRFEDVTKSAGVDDEKFWGTGASFVDLDNDGDLDLFACGYLCANKAFINDGKGRFTDRAKELGLDFKGGSMMMSFADIDNDGDLDGYLATTAVAPPDGTKFKVNFVPRESDGVEVPVVIPELREYWDILYLPGDKVRRVEAAQYDRLFRNDWGRFVEVSKSSGIDGPYFTLSATWFDYDVDGDPDLYVSNDYTGPDMLYRNKGDGTFENVIRSSMPHTPWFSMGSDVGDLNNDGLLDLFAADMSASSHYREKVMMGNMEDSAWFLDWAEPRQYMRNALYVNSGTDRFHEAAFMAGLSSTDWTWTPRIEDFDQDGYLDVFVTNGVMRDNMNSDLTEFANKNLKPGTQEYDDFWLKKPMRKEKNLAFRNLSDLKFESAGAEWGLEREGVSFGAATADFDGDGDPDLVVSNADGPVSIYRNKGSSARRVAVKLEGVAANRQALGAIIGLESGGVSQTRTITLARGWLSASETTALFGLGESTKVDRLEILWPGGARQIYKDLDTDQLYVITEPVAQPVPPAEPDQPPLFAKADSLAKVVHREIPFDDFRHQPLLPNKLSQNGPGIGWGDVDGDGDDDLLLGGARDQAAQLFLNSGEGSFTPKSVEAFETSAGAENLGVVFFDSEGDGDLDLYLANGSNEAPPGHSSYQDHLFLNDGKGGFEKAGAETLPPLTDSSGVVAPADFDRDGDLDLFVGSRVIPGQYPLSSPSRLLINDGGSFRQGALLQLGMVTSAI